MSLRAMMRNSVSTHRRKFHSQGKVNEVMDWAGAHPGMALFPICVLGGSAELGILLEKEKGRSLLV